MPRSLHLAIASAAALMLAAPAFAQDETTRPQERVVTYGELDLNSAAGADVLVRRIEQASDQVCGRHDGRTNTRQRIISQHCAVETAENGIADVNHPVVTARYYGSGYGVVEEGDAYYDPRLDPASPEYDATLDPNSPYYVPPK
jgi:UrcA family protein